METTTTSNKVNTQQSPDGYQVGQTSSDLVGFWGTTPVDKPAALTTQLTAITIADAAGTPDYALQAVTNSSPYGFTDGPELITFLYVVQNLQVRVAELEARLEECGLVTAN